jgi:hypothetical protein
LQRGSAPRLARAAPSDFSVTGHQAAEDGEQEHRREAAEAERAGDHRHEREAIDQQRARIVQQALAFENLQQPVRRLHLPPPQFAI